MCSSDLSLKSYRNLIENEYWCDGEDCVKEGFADKVVSASCGESLKGSKRGLEDRFLFMGIVVEIYTTRSKCPMITGVLDWNVYINGRPLFSNEVVDNAKAVPYSPTWYGRNYDSGALQGLDPAQIELLKKELDSRTQHLTSPNRHVIKNY